MIWVSATAMSFLQGPLFGFGAPGLLPPRVGGVRQEDSSAGKTDAAVSVVRGMASARPPSGSLCMPGPPTQMTQRMGVPSPRVAMLTQRVAMPTPSTASPLVRQAGHDTDSEWGSDSGSDGGSGTESEHSEAEGTHSEAEGTHSEAEGTHSDTERDSETEDAQSDSESDSGSESSGNERVHVNEPSLLASVTRFLGLGPDSLPTPKHSNPLGQHSNPLGQHSNPLGQHSNPLGQHSNLFGHQRIGVLDPLTGRAFLFLDFENNNGLSPVRPPEHLVCLPGGGSRLRILGAFSPSSHKLTAFAYDVWLDDPLGQFDADFFRYQPKLQNAGTEPSVLTVSAEIQRRRALPGNVNLAGPLDIHHRLVQIQVASNRPFIRPFVSNQRVAAPTQRVAVLTLLDEHLLGKPGIFVSSSSAAGGAHESDRMPPFAAVIVRQRTDCIVAAFTPSMQLIFPATSSGDIDVRGVRFPPKNAPIVLLANDQAVDWLHSGRAARNPALVPPQAFAARV